MFSTGHNDKMIEVLSGSERRRRRTPQEKIPIVQQMMEPGMTVSHVTRLHGVNANQVFTRRRQYQNASLTTVSVGEKELYRPLHSTAAMKQIKELHRPADWQDSRRHRSHDDSGLVARIVKHIAELSTY